MNSYSGIGASSLPRRALAGALLAGPASAQGRVRILATTAMLADAVSALALPAAQVESLMGEGTDPHLYRPTRADTARLLAADLVVLNGLRLEGRMDEVLQRLARSGRRVLAMAESLPRAELRFAPEFPDAADPHIWMDPLLWAQAAASLVPALAPLLPGAPLAGRLAEYQARMRRLHDYAATALAPLPAGRRVLVTAHDAFGYFGRRHGIEVESIQGLSTESEASLQRIEQLVALIVARRVPAVFAEASVPDRAMRALIEGAAARGHRVVLGGLLYSDSLGRPGTYAGTLEGMLDHNITTIARALGGEAPPGGLHGRLAA
ncbi:metal ABC transporter solute-binding protein, Zn/Mn family [Rhodovarius lipocyclicus]|uniref:metal ABC transporter solute-binding protein, Zn/Mn family n=1 Tax=Rhodovarius lipocyclicus TaxID=268410 RepID=UPI001F1E58D7|nr:zinc ABC transporter substrate-binding protein [Rhodovarius lipocyclicus]